MDTGPEFDDVIAHYGILGMKWGVRRTPEQLGRAARGALDERKTKKARTAAAKTADKARPRSSDAQVANRARRIAANAGTDRLSNQELQALVNRMNLEKQYSKHMGQDQKSTGAKWLSKWFAMEERAAKSKYSSPTMDLGRQVRKGIDKYKGKKT